MIRFVLLASLGLASLGFTLLACGDSGEEGLCTPAEEIFCKCRGGVEDGTKTCNDDGNSFGPCISADGECEEIETSTSSGDPQNCEPDSVDPCTCDDGMTMGETTCEPDGSGFGPCLVDGSECAAAGTLGFFEVCSAANDCQSGICDGFCTRACADYTECQESAEVFGDCVSFDGGSKKCAPYCFAQEDCAAYGAESYCSGVEDPTFIFAACGPWAAPSGMPYGTLCDFDPPTLLVGDPQNPQTIGGDCHLGLAGVQNVCVFGECSKACYENQDCPNSDCSSDGSTPGCCISEADCDA